MKQNYWPREARRDHLRILVDILEICEESKTKTQVMHCINTNYNLLESYLLQLKFAQLIEKSTTTNGYTTTKKGIKLIETWKVLQAMMKPHQIAPIVKTRRKLATDYSVSVP